MSKLAEILKPSLFEEKSIFDTERYKDEDIAESTWKRTIKLFTIDEDSIIYFAFKPRKFTQSKTNLFWEIDSDFDKLLEELLTKAQYKNLIQFKDIILNRNRKTGLILQALCFMELNPSSNEYLFNHYLMSQIKNEDDSFVNEVTTVNIYDDKFIFVPNLVEMIEKIQKN